MSGQGHPDTETIANSRAGLVGGLRGRRLAAHIDGCPRCAAVGDQLTAMTSMLASVPPATLPDPFQHQITAAIAAEAAARHNAPSTATAAAGTTRAGSADAGTTRAATAAAGTTRAGSADAGRTDAGRAHDGRAHGGRAGVARSGRSQGRQGRRFRPVIALVPVLACLLAGLGYLASSLTASSGPSVAASQASGALASASASAPAASTSPYALPTPAHQAPRLAPANGRAVPFLVNRSGDRYTAATLRAQASAALRSHGASFSGQSPATSAIPSPSSTAAPSRASAPAGIQPSESVVGCVLNLTQGVRPSYVDDAFYQGKPAYVIVVPNRVWVVGLGCTASKPDLITSLSLPQPGQ